MSRISDARERWSEYRKEQREYRETHDKLKSDDFELV